MPRTRCSRASSSTSVTARGVRVGSDSGGVGLGFRRFARGLGGLVLRALGLVRRLAVALGLGSVIGLRLGRLVGLGLGGLVGLGLGGLVGLGLGGLVRLCSGWLLSLGLLGLGRRILRCALAGLVGGGVGVLGGPAPALLCRSGVAKGLLDRGGEDLLPVLLGRRRLQRAFGTGQALELLPVAGDLKDLPHRVGRLRSHRQPVLRPVRVDLDERRLCLRVVLA